MKKIIKMAVIVAGMMLAAQANAQDFRSAFGVETPSFLAKFHVHEGTFKLRVYVGKREGNENTLQVSLRDESGNPLYTKKMDKNQRQATVDFDMAGLENGVYTLEMSDKNGKTVKKFYKETDVILVRTQGQLVALN